MGTVKLPRETRYKKSIGRYAAADFKTDSSLLPFSTAKVFYNFDFSSGVLRRGYGVKEHPRVPKSAARYWVYRYYSETKGRYVDEYMFQYKNGLLAWFNEDKQMEIYVSGIPFNPLSALNYRLNSTDVLLLSCEGRKLLTWNGRKIIEYDNSPSISSMALHYERLFVTSREERTKVFFSKNLDPTQWEIGASGGGFIELLDDRGFLNKVVSFGNHLYIFRDHGISRVTAYGDQTEFSVVNMFLTAGRIYASSIAVCGNCIMFLASDGLYRFDGYECTRVLTDISPRIKPDDDCACAFHDGKYYLACKIDFSDNNVVGCESTEGYKTNAVIVYDPSSGVYSISRGLNIRYMAACSYYGEDFLMCNENGSGGVIEPGAMRFENSLPARWESGIVDMGVPEKRKTLTDVLFDNDGDGSIDATDLGITLDGYRFVIPTSLMSQGELRMNLSAHKFTFFIETTGADVNITPLCIKYNIV